ncbi:ATP-binding protein [Streptomyces chryseus]
MPPSPLVHAEFAFLQRFSSTRRGARLARRLALHQLDAWGIAYGSEASEAAALVVAELAANAVTHGHVPGRDFELRLLFRAGADTFRIEVGDTRGDRRPERRGPAADGGVEEGGLGLLLVDTLASEWGVRDRQVGKTVWAVLARTHSM